MSFLDKLFNRSKKSTLIDIEETASSNLPTSNTDKPLSQEEHRKPVLHSPHIYDSPTYYDIRNNISIHQSSLILQYHDLAYVASLANDSLVMGAPIKHSPPGKMLEEYNKIFAENCEFATTNFRRNIKLSRKLDSHLYTRAQLFSNLRDIYPDFGQNMRLKVSKEEYDLYHSTMVNFRKSLSLDFTNEPLEVFSETLAAAQSKISEVVGTFGFSKACEIEDRFIISEINTFFAELAKAPAEQQLKTKRSTIELEDGTKISTIDFANKIREERISRLKKYAEINTLKGKSTNKSIESTDSHSEH